MPIFLPLLARFWPYIAIAVLGLGLYASIKHNLALSAQRDAAVKTANDNAAIAEAERAARKQVDKIVADYTAADEKRRRNFNQKRSGVAHATPSQDGPIAPVLRDTVNELPIKPNEADRDKTSYSPPPLQLPRISISAGT